MKQEQNVLAMEKTKVSLKEILKSWKLSLYTSTIGLLVGALPGAGGPVASFIAYNAVSYTHLIADFFSRFACRTRVFNIKLRIFAVKITANEVHILNFFFCMILKQRPLRMLCKIGIAVLKWAVNVEAVSYTHLTRCGKFYGLDAILNSTGVPKCTCGGTIKPDVVLYEEGLDSETIEKSVNYIANADVLIIGGTSLTVYPAAGLIDYYRGPKLILINQSVTPMDSRADLVISGPIGEVLGAAVGV